MARIRTIKPEFWTSEQIMNLSVPARLAFIGLWTHCDDGGSHPCSSRTLKAAVFPSDNVTSGDVQGWVDEMIVQRLVVVYDADGKSYWHVTGWNRHQRIDKPTFKHPKPPPQSTTTAPEIKEDVQSTPRPLVEDSTNAMRGLDPGLGLGLGIGLGVERNGVGEELFPTDLSAKGSADAVIEPKPVKQKKAKEPAPTAATWKAYASAFEGRYHVAPVPNARVNGQLANFLKLVPPIEAPEVAAFYVSLTDRFYIDKRHAVGQMLHDAETLRTRWATGARSTNAPSRHNGFDHFNYESGSPDGSLT